MATRMKDIADDLGLSVVTVSKVLRNHPDIGEETRERVLRRVRELNYEPNIMARSLVTGRSFLVGLVVPDLLHPFFAEVAKELSNTIRSKGYCLIVSSSEEDAEMEAREIRHLRARRLDAIVIASTRTNFLELESLVEEDDVLVLIDRELPGLNGNFVGIDDVAAGRMATNHLIDIGCRRIAHIRGRENSTGVNRYEGYRQALKARGLEYNRDFVINRKRVDTHSIEEGAEAMRLLLERNPRPDGVFCYNDPLAIGAMTTILDAGLRIPDDIALIGCGNLHYDNCLRVPLSSVDQHSEEIGKRAGELVLSIVEAKRRPLPTRFILDPALVVRASTQRSERHAGQQPNSRLQVAEAVKPARKTRRPITA
jgi:LacI family transcriptional regulator